MSNEAGMNNEANLSDVSDVLAIDSLLSAEERTVRERVRDLVQPALEQALRRRGLLP